MTFLLGFAYILRRGDNVRVDFLYTNMNEKKRALIAGPQCYHLEHGLFVVFELFCWKTVTLTKSVLGVGNYL